MNNKGSCNTKVCTIRRSLVYKRPRGLIRWESELRARAVQLTLSGSSCLLCISCRDYGGGQNFLSGGAGSPRAPGLICLLAAVLRLLFCGRKLGRKRYRDTPLKCSAAMQVGIVAPARLLLDTSVHKAPRDQVRPQVRASGTAIGERQGCGPCSYCALPSLDSGFVCG